MKICAIIGRYKNEHGTIVSSGLRSKNNEIITTDISNPITTLERCKFLIAKCETLVGHKLLGFKINDWRFYDVDTNHEFTDEELEEEIHPYRTSKTDYIYDKESNCLQIWKDGSPVYENNNGLICEDKATLADCLC